MFSTTDLNDTEKELFNFDKHTTQKFITNLDKDMFYLGGQIKMSHNDIINLDLIQQVREIDRKRYIKYGGPYNSFESQSIYEHTMNLVFIENMIKTYNEIMKLRENKKSNKIDLSYEI
jgi:hypothetical protein